MKAFPVTVLCAVMRVSRSGFYDYLQRYHCPNIDKGKTVIADLVKKIFDESRGSYGSRRIAKQMISDGYHIGRYKVRKIMKHLGLRAKTPKRFKLTTDSVHSFPVAPNVLDRRFDVASPNTVWAADISYVWTFEGWMYLAVVMDLYSRQIVGWSMNNHMRKELGLNALAMAYWQRKPAEGLVHHSDRGSQYACFEYQKRLKDFGMVANMSRKGNCWDNFVMAG